MRGPKIGRFELWNFGRGYFAVGILRSRPQDNATRFVISRAMFGVEWKAKAIERLDLIFVHIFNNIGPQ